MTEERPAQHDDELLQTFALLTQTLVAGYDVVDLLQTVVERSRSLLDATDAGIMLAADDDTLELIASTSESGRLVEALQISADAGPCIESFVSGHIVSVDDEPATPAAWAPFSGLASELGFRSVHAVPLRLQDLTIGTLNLLRHAPGELRERELVAARALADVATIGIVQERSLRETQTVREKLRNALGTRVVIEQAKGVVAQLRSISPEAAFAVIRDYSRTHQLPMSHVASALTTRTLSL